RDATALPPCFLKAAAWIRAANGRRIDVGVESLVRPSTPCMTLCVPNQYATQHWRLVAKEGTVHAVLPAVVVKLAPSEDSQSIYRQQHQLLSRPHDQKAVPVAPLLTALVFVLMATVVTH